MTFFAMNEVVVHRGPIQVIKGLSLQFEKGDIVSLIGANGAGKTTTLWTIVGLLKPSSGNIFFDGENITGLKPDEILRKGIALCPAERHLFPRMTVYENLMMGAFTRKSKEAVQKDLERVFLSFPRLKERLNQMGATLSGGEQQMLAMARSVMGNPGLLMMDEPSLGLAPILVREVGNLIRNLHQGGTTIFLVEQNALLALEVSEKTHVMELGEVVMSGRSKDLAHQDSVRKAFLGE
jgi:branched-chain amino acid transport system ATP-binding protein